MSAPTARGSAPLYLLGALGLASGAIYVVVTALSREFVSVSHLPLEQALRELEKRPIPLVLGLFALAFLLYLIALRVAVRAPQRRGLLALIAGCAVAFRAILLFSTPIQEIDIYRYLWDGTAGAARVNPYRYSPKQVYEARRAAALPPDLRRLVNVCAASPARDEILRRLQKHYPHLPSVYPPVSQAIFTFAATLTPDDAPLTVHLLIIKLCFIFFDLGTLAVLVGLLRWADRPVGWALAYAWCPLVLKEVANSGHLDALAVFLTTLAVALAARAYCPGRRDTLTQHEQVRSPVLMLTAAVVLGLAVGAKLYPVVLAPLLLCTYACLAGLRRAILPSLCFLGTTAAVCWPMLPSPPAAPPAAKGKETRPRVPVQDPSRGLLVFLRHWEVNDFFFRLVVENLQPDHRAEGEERAWFAVVPKSWRDELVQLAVQKAGVEESWAPFFLARCLAGLAFVLVCGWLVWRGTRAIRAPEWLEAAFLTMAWFWLLSPAQNPWYWLWALPLLPFARGRAWLLVSGFAFVSYLRFWLIYHWPNGPVAGTPYVGERFFDVVLVWAEYLPWLAYLFVDWIRRRQRPAAENPGQRVVRI